MASAWFSSRSADIGVSNHDIKIYHKAPYYLFKGAMYDDMTDWYAPRSTQQAS